MLARPATIAAGCGGFLQLNALASAAASAFMTSSAKLPCGIGGSRPVLPATRGHIAKMSLAFVSAPVCQHPVGQSFCSTGASKLPIW